MPIETNNWDPHWNKFEKRNIYENYKVALGTLFLCLQIAPNCIIIRAYLKSSTLKSRVGLDYTRVGYKVLLFGISK